jgi:hypothetical protein
MSLPKLLTWIGWGFLLLAGGIVALHVAAVLGLSAFYFFTGPGAEITPGTLAAFAGGILVFFMGLGAVLAGPLLGLGALALLAGFLFDRLVLSRAARPAMQPPPVPRH